MTIYRFQQRRNDTEGWEDANPVLASGEIGIDLDTGDFKVGNGDDDWDTLPYFSQVTADTLAEEFVDVDDLPALDGEVEPTDELLHLRDAVLRRVTVETVADLVASVLIDGAPGALNTLNELAAALGDDASFATTVTNALATKMAKASNLSDLASAGAARTNLGLGVVGLVEGVLVSNTVTETSLLSSPITIPANSLAVGDVLTLHVSGSYANLSSGNCSYKLRGKLGSFSFLDPAIYTPTSFATGMLANAVDVRATIIVLSIGATAHLAITGTAGISQSNVFNNATSLTFGKDIVSIDTTQSIALDVLGQMTSAGPGCQMAVVGASLTKQRLMS